MANDIDLEKKKMPHGVRKGGARFPKIPLGKALEYNKKLVAKTHIGALPAKTVLPGVFGTSSSVGEVRASALKQYGLLEGPATAYQASIKGKALNATPAEEREHLLQEAFLTPKIFKELFQTFHGDTVQKSKIEQRARALEVHPDLASECAQLFMESAAFAGIGKLEGETLILGSATAPFEHQEEVQNDEVPALLGEPETSVDGAVPRDSSVEPIAAQRPGKRSTPGAPSIALTIDVDSSSDPDKLEKQLKLLRSYGLV